MLSSGSFYSYTAVSRLVLAADLRGRFCINFRQSLASSTELPHTFFSFFYLLHPAPPLLHIIPGYTNYRDFEERVGQRTDFFLLLRASTAAKRLEATLPAPKGEKNLVPFRGKRSNGSKRIIFFPPGSIRYVFSSLSWPYSGERSMISNGLASLADYHFLACGRAPVLIFPITGRPVLLCVYNAR